MKDMNFKLYQDILKSEVLEFNKDKEWDVDEWNISYIEFKKGVSNWNENYVNKFTSKELAINWAREFYQDTDRYTHNYWIIKKDNGWYCARTTKPPYNVGIIVFIPEESNHQTSGMWDVDKQWVLLDENRIPTSEVTGWQYLLKEPTDPEFLKYKSTPI